MTFCEVQVHAQTMHRTKQRDKHRACSLQPCSYDSKQGKFQFALDPRPQLNLYLQVHAQLHAQPSTTPLHSRDGLAQDAPLARRVRDRKLAAATAVVVRSIS